MDITPKFFKRNALLVLLLGAAAACGQSGIQSLTPNPPSDPALIAQGRPIFRFDTYGDETFWTDTLRMHEVIAGGVSPAAALQVGLKVDVDTLPQAVKAALAAGQIDLNSPATTVTLLKLGAVVGVVGKVNTVGGRDTLVSVGVTCALCHSTVDNSFAPGIGRRLDGWPNRDLNPGAIIALSPALTAAQKAVYNSWGAGMYDARFNFDGQNLPTVIPPAFGLAQVRKEIYTGDDTVSYWNRYVAVTQMHGQGSFSDPRIAVNLVRNPDLVTAKLPALRAYQLSLPTPTAVASDFDAAAAQRGRAVFTGAGRCATCHLVNEAFTDVNHNRLHSAAEVGQDARYAQRSATKQYRTTPLRGLYHPPQLKGPYFHDGSAKTLQAVVDHYNTTLKLNLTAQQKADLAEYLKSL